MGCSLDTDVVTKEEQLLIDAQSSSFLSRVSSSDLESAINQHSSSQEITESQLYTALTQLTEKQPKHREGLFTLLSGVPRGELLAFVILVGQGDLRVKAELLFELGTDVSESERLTREAAEVLADDIISAASEVALKFCNEKCVSEYGKRMIKLKETAVEQLAAKMMCKSQQVGKSEFVSNYSDQPRLLTLTGVRQFVIGCGEKSR